MSHLIDETADRLFSDYAEAIFADLPQSPNDGAAPWPAKLWSEIQEMGFPLALLTEAEGGFDLTPLEAGAIIRRAALYALPVPLGDTMIANLVLARAGLPIANGPASILSGATFSPEEGRVDVSVKCDAVAWARASEICVVMDDLGNVARLETGWIIEEGSNLANEARDRVSIATKIAADAIQTTDLRPEIINALGAMVSAQSLAGALEETLTRCIAYTKERIQFGRPLSTFQVLQQNLADAAGQVAAARAGADMAMTALPLLNSDPTQFIRQCGAAKLRASEAAGHVARAAHQVHGAIGFAREFSLHALTTRLWAWRDEFGTEDDWADMLGAEVLTQSPDDYWPNLTQCKGSQT